MMNGINPNDHGHGNNVGANHDQVLTPPGHPMGTAPTVAPVEVTVSEDSKPLKVQDHAERYWQILQNNAEWTRFSDSKAGLILTTYGVLFTIIYTNASAVFTAVKDSPFSYFTVGAFVIASMASVGFAFVAVRPRLENKEKISVIYFQHIANHEDASAYKKHAGPILDDPEQYTDHLAGQIYALSKVASNKYYWTSLSIYAFMVSLGALLLTVGIYIIKVL